MKDASETMEPVVQRPANAHLLALGHEDLRPLSDAFAEARAALRRLADGGEQRYSKRAAILMRQLDAFEPNVTLVGQVKAGKTALTNVLVGSVGLLPSDVNPWTSVVTGLHLNNRTAPKTTKAEFSFFEKDEWSRIVATGGRLGELAERAGSHEELDRIQAQIVKMRDQSKARLGASFEMLLGKSHKYGYYDNALIERYVCMGETDEAGMPLDNAQGRFADITKSAEIFIDMPEYPGSICLRDTPGVNDTFMVREQITIRSLRGSEICLVVLSAHQALNTTDMALVRLISNFEKRQIILFVNRIDELPNPAEQIPEIRNSIIETLRSRNAPHDCEIVFGSAKWAETALTGSLNELSDESQAALFDWAEANTNIAPEDPNAFLWMLSGVPSLNRAINRRILDGSGKRLLENIRSRVANLTAEVAAERSARQTFAVTGDARMEPALMRAEVEKLAQTSIAELDTTTERLRVELRQRLDKLQGSFLRRATDALIAHLERNGEQESWQYDATGLRVLLRSAYFQFASATKKEVAVVYAHTTDAIHTLYAQALGGEIPGFAITPPTLPPIPPPVVVGKTIALDLNNSWWRRWWGKRRSIEAIAADYAGLIESEVAAIIDELERTQIADLFGSISSSMVEFLNEQREALMRLTQDGPVEGDMTTFQAASHATEEALGDVLNALDRVAA
jgi:Dynamin family